MVSSNRRFDTEAQRARRDFAPELQSALLTPSKRYGMFKSNRGWTVFHSATGYAIAKDWKRSECESLLVALEAVGELSIDRLGIGASQTDMVQADLLVLRDALRKR